MKVRRDVCYKEILCSTEEAVVVFKKCLNVIISWLGGGRGLEGFGSVTVKFIRSRSYPPIRRCNIVTTPPPSSVDCRFSIVPPPPPVVSLYSAYDF